MLKKYSHYYLIPVRRNIEAGNSITVFFNTRFDDNDIKEYSEAYEPLRKLKPSIKHEENKTIEENKKSNKTIEEKQKSNKISNKKSNKIIEEKKPNKKIEKKSNKKYNKLTKEEKEEKEIKNRYLKYKNEKLRQI